MKFVLCAMLALSATAFAGNHSDSKTIQTEKTNYGTRSDGKVVPTSKEVKTKTMKEKPQMEQAEDDADAVIYKEKVKTKTYND